MRRIIRRPTRPGETAEPAPETGATVEESADWAAADIAMPRAKRLISLRIDAEVLDWFQEGGKGYQTRMNAVLRAYMAARKG